MITKIFSVLSLFISLCSNANAQHDVLFSLGGNLIFFNANAKYDPNSASSSGTDIVLFSQQCYCISPWLRYNLKERRNSSISIGMPLSVGVNMNTVFLNGGGTTGMVFDIPITADYNIGYGSKKDINNEFGCFFGLGFEYLDAHYEVETYNTLSAGQTFPNISAPCLLIHGGIRFPSSFTLRGGYATGKAHVITMSAYINIGMKGN